MSDKWTEAANWDAAGIPTSGEADGTIVFFGTSGPSFQNIAGLVVDEIVFTSDNNTLTLFEPLFLNGNVVPTTIRSNLGVNNVITGSKLVLQGAAATIQVSNAGTLTIASQITGNFGIQKTGLGALELATTISNPYTGITDILDGTLRLNTTNAGLSATIFVGDAVGGADSAVLQFDRSNQIPETASVVVRSDGRVNDTPFVLQSITNLTLFDGQVHLEGLLQIQEGGTVTASGAATSVIDGDGELRLEAGTITFDAASNLIVAARITRFNSGAGLTKTGAATLELSASGTGNTYDGTTRINDGTLRLSTATDNAGLSATIVVGTGSGETGSAVLRLANGNEIPDTAAVTILRSGVLDLNVFNDTIGALTLSSHASVVTSAGTLTLGGDVTATANAFGVPTIAGRLSLGAANRTFISTEGTFLSDLVITAVISGAAGVGLVKAGPGGLRLDADAANTYSGTTVVNAGVLDIRHPSALGLADGTAATGTTVADGATLLLKSLAVGNEALILNGAGSSIPFGALGVTFNNGNSSWAGPVTLATTSSIGVFTTADRLTLTGIISGPGGLTKVGVGPLELAETDENTYTGTTTVKDGVLALNNTAINGAVSQTLVIGDSTGSANSAVVLLLQGTQIPNDGTVTIHSDGRLDLNDSGESIGLLTLDGGSSVSPSATTLLLTNNVSVTAAGASSPATITSRVNLSGSIHTFTVANEADLRVDSVIRGASGGGLIKDGAGRMVLSAINTYIGSTTLNAGVLQVDGSQPASAVSLTGGTLAGGGTVGPITATGGTIAPGLLTATTPVVLHSGNLVMGAATFAPLISGTVGGAADQIAVTGTVILAETTLAPIRTGIGAAVGQTFRVIDNDAADPVAGTFAGLPEGATLPDNGQTFVITYHGGDGNDVELKRIANILVTGPEVGAAPRVRVFDAETQAQKFDFLAYPASFKGGVRVASADVNHDGFFDIITVPGPGTAALVKVFSGATQPGQTPQLLHVLRPYGNFKGGAFVAVGDVNGDGTADVITGPGAGVAPIVKVFNGVNGALLSSFPAFPASFKGGVTVAAGDVNGDGKLDIITGMGSGSQPRVRVFDAATHAQLAGAIGSFLAYPASFKGGVFVAAGDLNGDGAAEVITGPGIGTTPLIEVFTPATVATPRQILAYPPGQKRGVRVGTGDVDGDGKADILTAPGPSGSAQVRAFNGVSAAAIDAFFAEAASFKKGLFVAGSRAR